MNLRHDRTAAGLLIGLVAGVFGGLVGIGGGMVMIPLMVGMVHLRQQEAHGTSLVALVCNGLVGAATYALYGNTDWETALIIAAAAVWPARFGAKYCHALPEAKLRLGYGLFMVAMAVLLVAKPYLAASSTPMEGWQKIVALAMTGAVTGFMSGLMGVGGAPILITAMVLVIGLSQYTAQGSSLLAMVPAGIVGAYTHWRLGNVNVPLLKGLVPGIVLGVFCGGLAAHRLPEAALRITLSVVILWTASRFLKKKK